MKTVVKEGIAFKDMKKYLPKRYGDLFPVNFRNREESVNAVIFPYDKARGVITSSCIQKILDQLKDPALLTVYFASSFSTEAKALAKENNGLIFCLSNYEWTDESWHKCKNGCL